MGPKEIVDLLQIRDKRYRRENMNFTEKFLIRHIS